MNAKLSEWRRRAFVFGILKHSMLGSDWSSRGHDHIMNKAAYVTFNMSIINQLMDLTPGN